MKSFMDSDAEGFIGLKRGDAFYKPMIEVVNLLRNYDFTIYIVTATERNIVREIGKKPVLAFGNSSGDTAMCAYVLANNPYPALSYMVTDDDDEREWGDPEGARERIDSYTELGIRTISMRDDFITIYGDDVQKDKTVTGN